MISDYMLTFSSVEFLKPIEKYQLFEYFGNAFEIMTADYNKLIGTGILTAKKTERLLNTEINRNIAESLDILGIKPVAINDEDYPKALNEIYDPPLVIYIRGKMPEGNMIAIVGSRKCSEESFDASYNLASGLASEGYVIVSGMARGIDTAAHKGALQSGNTIAVLGNGPDICYPYENKELMQKIIQKCCVISEYPPGKRPEKYTFPARNRIISGLSSAVIAAEAGKKSGALITIDFALEQGKDIYILDIDGEIHGEGLRKMYEDGAKTISLVSNKDINNNKKYEFFIST